MNKTSVKITRLFKTMGLSPRQFILALKGYQYFFRNKKEIKKQLSYSRVPFSITDYYPCPADRFEEAGTLPLHYFHQDLYVAQRLFKNNPVKHVDIGSRIDGFIAHAATFRQIEVMDIREIKKSIPNVVFLKADIMSDNWVLNDYCDSVSCLHTIEHLGLGRYGDPVDVNGHIKGFNNIVSMIKKGGRLYLSTVIGPQRIEFDAHRVFSVKYLLDLLKKDFSIERFSYIDDNNIFHPSSELSDKSIPGNFGCNYGCGIFELIKK